MPARLTPVTAATPDEFVVAVPTLVPLRVKETVLPLTGAPLPEVRVAERLTVPPNVPEAALTERFVVVRLVTADPELAACFVLWG